MRGARPLPVRLFCFSAANGDGLRRSSRGLSATSVCGHRVQERVFFPRRAAGLPGLAPPRPSRRMMGAVVGRRCLEWLLGLYFLSHIPITLFMDLQLLLPPELYPVEVRGRPVGRGVRGSSARCGGVLASQTPHPSTSTPAALGLSLAPLAWVLLVPRPAPFLTPALRFSTALVPVPRGYMLCSVGVVSSPGSV
jgi:hypothetical protein